MAVGAHDHQIGSSGMELVGDYHLRTLWNAMRLYRTATEPREIRSGFQSGLLAGLASLTCKGRLTAEQAGIRAVLIRCATDLAGVTEVDLVIEAVFEDLAVKQEVFLQLDRLAKPGAILATNTSYLDIEAIAAVTGRPQAVIGMHFFSPAQVMKLLEVVRTRTVAPAVLPAAVQLGERLGKTTVAVGNYHGFVDNRLLTVREREATLLLEEGAAPEQVDWVLRDFGFPITQSAQESASGGNLEHAASAMVGHFAKPC